MNALPNASAAIRAARADILPDTEPRHSAPKLAEDLAVRIEQEIMDLGWPLGSILGSEPELIERYGVSRAVFREAVRVVEHHGAARMRRGPKGGLVITVPDFRAVERPATLYLDYSDVSTGDLVASRTALELTGVDLATSSLDDEGREMLQAALEVEREVGMEGFQRGAGHGLHIIIARLSRNPVNLLFVQTLTSLTFERTRGLRYDEHQVSESHRAHEAIVAAMLAGDSELAQQRMRRHLAAAVESYRGRGQGPSPLFSAL